MVRWRRHTAEVPAAIWRCPHEPGDPGNVLDTGPIWAAEIAGESADPVMVWTMRKRPITPEEYRYRVADQAWLRRARPDDPKVAPRRPVDLSTMKAPF
jgi:alkanesulfonate monooxygenase SsuD/methylene tetrahydromethanopterin reductase-like flavin-dependent oxidoreductase (luciferase family)